MKDVNNRWTWQRWHSGLRSWVLRATASYDASSPACLTFKKMGFGAEQVICTPDDTRDGVPATLGFGEPAMEFWTVIWPVVSSIHVIDELFFPLRQ